MRNMKRAAVLLAAVMMLACTFLMTGCHGSKEKLSFVIPDELDTSGQYEITFWAKNDTNRSQIAVYNNAVEAFETLYPNVKINIRLYTDYGKIYNDVITNISTDTTPNVCITYPDQRIVFLWIRGIPSSGMYRQAS